MTLRLGVIGLSEGNGHPYSWSAIFNGYDPVAMQDCGFPVIPEYLAEQTWPQDQLADARVTHIWAQDVTQATHVAQAALIDHVVHDPADMIGQIDGLLLARDDAENHLRFATPFLQAGLPVYVDKPAALSVAALDQLYAQEQYEGQIFTCSALRYAPELHLSKAQHTQIGPLRLITASIPKSWECYGIHLIDPILAMVPNTAPPELLCRTQFGTGATFLAVHIPEGPDIQLTTLGQAISGPLAIRVHGTDGWLDLTFQDSFGAFRAALAAFVTGIQDRSVQSPKDVNYRAIRILEMGRG